MPKVGMEPIRRRQLIEATISSIGQYGLGDTTVVRISKEAGVSSGIIHHYFGGKDELLEASMRMLLQQLRSEVIARLAAARTPRERLEAVIDANFAPSQFDPQVIGAWLAFWAQVRHAPKLARLQRINARRLRSNLLFSFRRLLPAERAPGAARGLAALIDGLWLRASLDGSPDAEEARAIARGFVENELRA